MNNSYVKPEVDVIEIKASQATIMTASDDPFNMEAVTFSATN